MKKTVFFSIFCATIGMAFTSCKSSKDCQCPYPVSSSIEIEQAYDLERSYL